MEKITVYERQDIAQGTQLNPALFADYLAWIDRSEKTARAYSINLRQFAAWLAFSAIAAPVRADILSYRQWLATEHEAIALDPDSAAGWKYRRDSSGNIVRITCRTNTVAQYLRSVCQFFRWTAASGLYPNIAENIHAPKLRHDTHRKDALTAQDVLTIENSIAAQAERRTQAAQQAQKDTEGRTQRSTEQGKRLQAIYLLAVNAGLRTIEISRANVKDLETRGGQSWLYIWGKGHAEPDQRKPLAPEVAAAIRDYLSSRTDKPTGASPLFVATGNRSGGQRLAETTISKMLKKAMREAGFDSERITAHSLRHTAGTNVQQLTGDLYTTQQYMRHANPATTEIYLHVDTEQAEAQIAQRLYNRYHGGPEKGSREKLAQIIARMTPQQLEQLTGIAAAIV